MTKFEKIEEYYSRTLEYIQKNDLNKALKVLHNEMPMELYDASLDLLDNRNVDVKHLKVKELVIIVDNLLNKNSSEEEGSFSDLNDGFINNIF